MDFFFFFFAFVDVACAALSSSSSRCSSEVVASAGLMSSLSFGGLTSLDSAMLERLDSGAEGDDLSVNDFDQGFLILGILWLGVVRSSQNHRISIARIQHALHGKKESFDIRHTQPR